MTKTVEEHFENCKQVNQIVDDANALLTKVQGELSVARTVLEALDPYQHPKVVMRVPYQVEMKEDNSSPSAIIKREIQRINELLGDRA